jgi:outer membrane protein TolC
MRERDSVLPSGLTALLCAALGCGLEAQDRPARPQEPAATIPVDAEAEARGHSVRHLSLDDALRLGRANNVELRAGELLPEQARQDLLIAEAVFQPELYGDVGIAQAESPSRNSFQPSIERETIDATMGWRQRVMTGGLFDLAYRAARFDTESVSGAFPERQFTSDWAVSYTQPLLRGAWSDYNLARIDAARHGVARARHDYERSIQDTLLLIVEAYWELAFSRENYRVVFEALAVAREQLRITLERIRVRELAPRDRVADEAEVARREEDLIAAEHEVRRCEDDLRRLVYDDAEGKLWRANLRTTEPIAVTPATGEIAFEPLADVAMQQRPDLKAARSLVAEAELDLLQAARDVLPGLDIIGSYSSDGVRDHFSEGFADAFDQEFPEWGLRLQFSLPVGNQAARAARRRAELEVERRQRTLYGAMLDVTKEVRDAVRALQSLSLSIRASGESVRLAESNLETEQVKLGVGSSTAFEVQRRNQELREARSRHLRNQSLYRVAQGRLLHAQGLLQEPPP